MKQLCVTIHVTPAAAVRAGKTQVGETTLTITDADLASLTPEQRDALARHVANESGWASALSNDAPPVAEATIESLKALLDARIARQARDAEARRQNQEYAARAEVEHQERARQERQERERLVAERQRKDDEDRAERERETAAARATVRDFLLRHMESEDVSAWFAQLSDHHAAKPEIKRIIMTAIAKYLNKQNLSSDDAFAFYADSCGYRYGESSIDDEVSDLSVYRRMRFIQLTIDDALEEDGGMGEVGFNVNPVKAWRPADDGDAEDEIDEDGEVPLPDFFRVRVTVGDVNMNLYVS